MDNDDLQGQFKALKLELLAERKRANDENMLKARENRELRQQVKQLEARVADLEKELVDAQKSVGRECSVITRHGIQP